MRKQNMQAGERHTQGKRCEFKPVPDPCDAGPPRGLKPKNIDE
jgi:hypothetical protein